MAASYAMRPLLRDGQCAYVLVYSVTHDSAKITVP